tara:strand:- start:152 stop:616 length:465 start_codon:yes stop_codon:yes gene_type:complete
MLTATNRSNIKISKEIELKKFSEKISKFIKQFNTIFLYGDLGVGKTTFVKYFINNLQKKEKTKITEVPSPTFNIVYEYKIKKSRIQHFDLYRLKKKKECLNIGLFEDENVISIIEWPEKVHFKPKKRIEIYLKYFDNYKSRRLKIKFFGKNEAK